MTILRYTASIDTTITNAFQEDLSTRGTGSNMGASDILEVFSIYGQTSGSDGLAPELSRALVKFPVTALSSDRSAGTLPASGSVEFYLKLYNSAHSRTTPDSFTMSIAAVSASWQEGYGLDMENYEDLTYDGIGSNWINANNSFTSASVSITALSKTAGQANTRVLTVADSSGNSVNFSIDNGTSTSTATVIAFGNANSNASQFATNIVSAVNLAKAASTLNVTASSDGATVTLKQTAEGIVGNDAADISGTAVTDSVVTGSSGWVAFANGDGKWASIGGDYHTSPAPVTQTFDTGLENLEVKVTDIVEAWLGSTTNYGFGVRLSDSYEAYYSSSTGQNTSTLIHNTSGATKSYYTKMFFGRGTEFFFKRPVLEARWSSVTRDDRANFHFSSSILPAADNLHRLYFYNYINGRLTDIAGSNSAVPTLKLYYASGSVPEGTARGFKNSSNVSITSLAATRASTGTYYVELAATSSIVTSTYSYLVDVWEYSSAEVFTGSAFIPKKFNPSVSPVNRSYVLSMPNLRERYRKDQTIRFRMFARDRNWSPTIYSKANKAIEGTTIATSSFRVLRVVDDLEVVPYGTGSDKQTVLSYDLSGSYFDLDMKMLEPGYQYGFMFSFYDGYTSTYVEQPYLFKFRVEA